MVFEGITAAFLVWASVSDIRTKRIPNVLTLSTLVLGLLLHTITDGWSGALYSGWGIAAGFVPAVILYALRAIGAGDVKLFAALGAWMGAAFTWQTFLYSILFGGIIAAVLMLYHYRSIGQRFVRVCMLLAGTKSISSLQPVISKPKTFPFMTAVLPAACVVYVLS